VVQLWYAKKKITAGPNEAGYETCIKLWPMVEHAKRLSGIITNYINSSASRHNKLYTVAAVFYTQKNHHCYEHQTEDVGDSVRNYCMAFYGYHASKCTEDKDAIQKYISRNVFPLTGNGKYICKGHHFYAELSQMQKTYKN
jgi:hypothetical protein